MQVPAPKTAHLTSSLRCLLLLLVVLLVAPGCTRTFFRERADKDVVGVITQKNVFPDWKVENWNVYPDPRSRFADPSRPDRPPYPADDYAARVLAPNPQAPTKKAGAGVFEGTGYLTALTTWDSQNRASDPGDMPDPLPRKGAATPQVGGATKPDLKDIVAPPVEKLPMPKSVSPAPTMTGQAVPAQAPAVPSEVVDKDPWVAAGTRSARAGITPEKRLPGTLPAPSITESHSSQVIVAVGEAQEGDRVVPVVMVLPSVSPNTAAADPPVAGQGVPPGQLPVVPGSPQVGKTTPGGSGAAVIATGPAASDFLNTLVSDKSNYRINMEQSVEMGILNSREFQAEREDLYLAALPVTLQRFNLAAQGFFTEVATSDFAGKLLGKVPQNSETFSTTPSLSKLFPTGALLVVKLANQVVVDLSHGQPTVTLSNISLNLTQPFLQGGGYAVTLEPLTQAERNLVYAIRSYARFRKVFYLAIAGGGNYTNNPYGFPGLSENTGRSIGNNFTAPDTGYLPCLLAAAVIANQRKNIEYLENLLKLFRAFREGGVQSDLQVAQVESQLVSSRYQLLGTTNPSASGGVSNVGVGNGIRAYLDAVDSFKMQLGIPITIGVDLDQSQLRPMRQQLSRFESVYAQSQDLEAAARQFNPNDPIAQFRDRWRRFLTEAPLIRGTKFANEIVARWGAWERANVDELNRKLANLNEERRKLLDRRADRQLKGIAEPDEEVQKLEDLEAELDLGAFEQAVRAYLTQPWAKETGRARSIIQAGAYRDVFNAFYQLILEGRNERLARIRQQWPKLPPILVDGVDVSSIPLDDAYTAAVRAALLHRLDLMSARGQVVDAWRQIKVAANALQGVFTVGYNLSSNTPAGGSKPFAFSGANTDNQLVFTAELPLVRRAERNNYRSAQINYQLQRRTLQAFEDNIVNDVRTDIRGIRTLTELYKLQQRLVELGYYQVDNAQALLFAPPALGAPGQDAGTAAALTNQVLQAQNSLVTAQNTLFTIWINYIIARMDFFTDTDLMQLDERGIWRDEYIPGNDDPDRAGPGAAGPRAERLPPPGPGAR